MPSSCLEIPVHAAGTIHSPRGSRAAYLNASAIRVHCERRYLDFIIHWNAVLFVLVQKPAHTPYETHNPALMSLFSCDNLSRLN